MENPVKIEENIIYCEIARLRGIPFHRLWLYSRERIGVVLNRHRENVLPAKQPKQSFCPVMLDVLYPQIKLRLMNCRHYQMLIQSENTKYVSMLLNRFE